MIESELKIPVDALDEIRRRLGNIDAERISDCEREVNTLFDTPDGQVAAAGQVLRVRRVGDHHILTFKGPAAYHGGVKQRREIELEVSSSEHISELLHALGYAPGIRYEKDRESWRMGRIRIDLDHTPMGDFVEIEGPIDGLEDAAVQLGLDPADAVAQSYLSLWQSHCLKHSDFGPDMVFDR